MERYCYFLERLFSVLEHVDASDASVRFVARFCSLERTPALQMVLLLLVMPHCFLERSSAS